MSNIDWSQVITKEDKAAKLAKEKLQAATAVEQEWQAGELVIIARQLQALEEAEVAETEADIPPDLLPGTRIKWLQYRTKVANWKSTNADFPDSSKRPIRPQE